MCNLVMLKRKRKYAERIALLISTTTSGYIYARSSQLSMKAASIYRSEAIGKYIAAPIFSHRAAKRCHIEAAALWQSAENPSSKFSATRAWKRSNFEHKVCRWPNTLHCCASMFFSSAKFILFWTVYTRLLFNFHLLTDEISHFSFQTINLCLLIRKLLFMLTRHVPNLISRFLRGCAQWCHGT